MSTFNKAMVQTAFAMIRYSDQTMVLYVSQYEHLASKLEPMDCPMNESLLITRFFKYFANNAGEKYSAVMEAFQTQEKISWVQATGRMVQEYDTYRLTNGVEEDTDKSGDNGGTERALNAKERKCWYCKKLDHKKSECRKRKADKKEREDDGRFNGTESVHLARAKGDDNV